MFEEKFTEAVIVENPTGNFVDGQPEYEQVAGTAIIIESSARGIDSQGNVDEDITFIIKTGAAPAENGRIVHGGTRRDLKSVKICRDLDGNIECYRCKVVK